MSDGRFSSKPIRSERTRESSWRPDDFTADPRLLTDDARAFMQSPAVQRHINDLIDYPLPEGGPLKCAPLHKNTPDGATEMGRPLASAVLVQEYLIGLIFLRVAGWIFMAFGGLILFGGIMNAIAARGNLDAAGPIVGLAVFGLGIGGVGVWFGIFRGRVIDEMCWFCPRGMIWRTGSAFDWYAWDEVREVYCQPHADRPAIGIRFDRNLSLISFGNVRASRLLVDYIESRASAACAPLALQQIAEGRTVRFGSWRLSRSALRRGDTEVEWRDIEDVQISEREVHIYRRNGRDVTILMDEIPFPKMFTALVRGIHAYSRNLPL